MTTESNSKFCFTVSLTNVFNLIFFFMAFVSYFRKKYNSISMKHFFCEIFYFYIKVYMKYIWKYIYEKYIQKYIYESIYMKLYMKYIWNLLLLYRSMYEIYAQFSSVSQSCPTLWNPMDISMPGFPVHHQLLRPTQTHVHWVGDAIQHAQYIVTKRTHFNHHQDQEKIYNLL